MKNKDKMEDTFLNIYNTILIYFIIIWTYIHNIALDIWIYPFTKFNTTITKLYT